MGPIGRRELIAVGAGVPAPSRVFTDLEVIKVRVMRIRMRPPKSLVAAAPVKSPHEDEESPVDYDSVSAGGRRDSKASKLEHRSNLRSQAPR